MSSTLVLLTETKAPVRPVPERPPAVFHPSIWGDQFLAYASDDMLKDKQGKFKESLIGDVRGLLSLHEAIHPRVRGEDILDEALEFTTTHLNSALPNLSNNPIEAQVAHALIENQPIHKGLTRLESRHFISCYEQDDSHNKVLLDFAKLDFNLLQKLHERELSEFTRWWKELDVARNFAFARDRVVELYFWILGVYYEPQYFPAIRINPTKVICLISIIDDMYDASNATIEELASSMTQFPAVPNTKNSTAPDDVTQRRSANFHPSIWGAHFLSYNSDVTEVDGKVEQQLEQLKERVRNILMEADIPSQKLNLIDAIQRLGVAYHFETEIEAALEHIYETYDHEHDHKNADREELYAVALSFRLLRQEGFPVSSDVFNKFKDNKGKFQQCLTDDVRGMLSLYEATHLRVHGEDILDEALDFTTTHLNSALPNLNNPNAIAAQVLHALNQPIRKGLTRLESRHYISFYEQDDTHNKVLLDFAKLDFNLLQKLHQRELSEITRWWKDLDFASKLPFARDRVVECYFWILGVYFEPQYFLARRIMTKVISLTSIIDDIYDVYGTLEELVLFTDAIRRWESSALDQLPEYMKVCYQALMDVYNMIDEEMTREGTSYRLDYAKSAMKNLVRAYFDEAKWFHEGYVPSMEEYMRVALVTSGYKMLATTSFVGMGDLVTKEAFEWVSSDPLIVEVASVIGRLMDDMAGHKFEQERGHVASAVECYMKQHGATEEVVLLEFQNRVTNAWKDMNAECLRPTAVPMPLLARVLNLARVINVIYKDEDTYTHSGTKLKNFVISVLIDSVPIN